MYIWRQAYLFANQIRIMYKCVSWKQKKKEEIFIINEEQRSYETLGLVITTAFQREPKRVKIKNIRTLPKRF